MISSLSSCLNDPHNQKFDAKTPAEKAFVNDYNPPQYKWGWIDSKGQLVIENKYDDIRDFSENLAAANFQGQWGYLNKIGKIIIPFQYRTAHQFDGGITMVQDFDLQWTCLDKSGMELHKAKYEEVRQHQNGLIPVKSDGNWGIVNQKGELLLEYKYQTIRIDDKYAIVTQNNKQLLFDPNNGKLGQVAYDKIYKLSQSARRFKENKKYGYLDQSGLPMISPLYNEALDFKSENTIVRKGNQYLLINQKNEVLRKLNYEKIQQGNQGFFFYRRNEKWGILDNLGDEVSSPDFKILNRFSEGLAGFSNGENWGYVDQNGRIVILPVYPLIWDFVSDRARAIDPSGIGYIDKEGYWVIDPQFIEVRDFKDGMARVQVFRF